ncbi:hypothetical protein [Verrucomicrobium sp. BvORR034]|uniref:hypothetical protein n=1 Tax=Verrucomicrobium sp. BvORR034 TaxID=1396418 RepID=UPI0006785F90|nr:hypothetical protein [Verrucomicrobium sp. BvORR034]
MTTPFKPGLDVLNTGHGHAEINFDPAKCEEVEVARNAITDMLQRGYLLFLEGADGKIVKVEAFDATQGRYIIGDCSMHPAATPAAEPPKRRRGRPPGTKRGAVPMDQVRATAMGRSAGG